MKKKETSAPVLDEKGRPPLTLNYPQTFKVGFAFAIIMLFWTAYDFVIPLLLENAYGLPSWARGIIMGLDNLLSLFMLPLFGKLSDNAHGKLVKKWGRRTPFIVIGTVCAVVLMVFVPVVTLKQQAKAMDISAEVEAQLNDDTFMEPLLEKWYANAQAGESGSINYCDLELLKNDGLDVNPTKYYAIRYDACLSEESGFLGLGGTTYVYKPIDENGNALLDENGNEIKIIIETAEVDGETVLVGNAPNGKSYQSIKENNALYKKYVASAINNYISQRVYNECTKTSEGIKSLVIYMVILLLVLIAMATFRSPAVALMPDVTPKPLRSQGNAIINLCGGVGGAIAFLIYTVVLFGERLHNYVIIFGSVAGGMLLLLAGFLALVNERKMVAKCQEICKEYEIDDFAEGENPEAEKFAEELIEEGDAEYNLDSKPSGDMQELLDESANIGEAQEALDEQPQENVVADETLEFAKQVVENSKKKHATPKEWWNAKSDTEKSKLKSFVLILASIFMWFMGYNAISSNLSIYTTKALNLSTGVASIISGVSMGISAIAFIPVGYMAAKIGRRKSIMIGFAMAVVSFFLIFLVVQPKDNWIIPAVLFALFYLIAGFGLIIANVNTFPMVTELSTSETVGQYTGYYYMATMSAQAITPAIGGAIMDAGGNKFLFLYSAICVVIAIVLMVFVKHGDSVPTAKGRKLTKEEKKQIRLDALDAD